MKKSILYFSYFLVGFFLYNFSGCERSDSSKKTKIISLPSFNSGIQVDVMGDGSCMLHSFTSAYYMENLFNKTQPSEKEKLAIFMLTKLFNYDINEFGIDPSDEQYKKIFGEIETKFVFDPTKYGNIINSLTRLDKEKILELKKIDIDPYEVTKELILVLKRKLALYMFANKKDFEVFFGVLEDGVKSKDIEADSFEAYLKSSLSLVFFLNEPSISAMNRLFRIPIRVFKIAQGELLEHNSQIYDFYNQIEQREKPITLLNINNGHYNFILF